MKPHTTMRWGACELSCRGFKPLPNVASKTTGHITFPCTGHAFPPTTPLLYAAEKYDRPGPASTVRALLRTPAFSDAPLHLYATACHFQLCGQCTRNVYTLARPRPPRPHPPCRVFSASALRTSSPPSSCTITGVCSSEHALRNPPFLTNVQLNDATVCDARAVVRLDGA